MPGTWEDDVITFWFEDMDEKQWFKRDDTVDAAIRDRFSDTYATVRGMDPSELSATPRTALAAIIMLDQFTRNMFRDDPRAFESDPLAQQIADKAIAAGYDQKLTPTERWFMYMPFMHSEDLAHQDRAVALFGAMNHETGLKYAHLHRDIIVKFGRFPHRNAVLNRQTTAQEQAHLDEHGGF